MDAILAAAEDMRLPGPLPPAVDGGGPIKRPPGFCKAKANCGACLFSTDCWMAGRVRTYAGTSENARHNEVSDCKAARPTRSWTSRRRAMRASTKRLRSNGKPLDDAPVEAAGTAVDMDEIDNPIPMLLMVKGPSAGDAVGSLGVGTVAPDPDGVIDVQRVDTAPHAAARTCNVWGTRRE
jgi:hypothetical protein